MQCMLLVLLVLALAAPALAQKPFDVDALLKLARVSDPQVSPDGKTVAFTVRSVDLAANTKPTNIYVAPLAGGAPVKITNTGTVNERARGSLPLGAMSQTCAEPPRSEINAMDFESGDQRGRSFKVPALVILVGAPPASGTV